MGCVKNLITTRLNPEWPSRHHGGSEFPPILLEGARPFPTPAPGLLWYSGYISESLGVCFLLCKMERRLGQGESRLGGRGPHRYGKVSETQVWWEAGSRLGPRTLGKRRIQKA